MAASNTAFSGAGPTILTPGSGILVYIVPWYALRASIRYLAQRPVPVLPVFPLFLPMICGAAQQVVLLASYHHAPCPTRGGRHQRQRCVKAVTRSGPAPRQYFPAVPRRLLPRTVVSFAPTTTMTWPPGSSPRSI